MIFLTIVYALVVAYILNKYYTRKEYAIALPKVAVLLPMAIITLAAYFLVEFLVSKNLLSPKYEPKLRRTMNKLEDMIKNER